MPITTSTETPGATIITPITTTAGTAGPVTTTGAATIGTTGAAPVYNPGVIRTYPDWAYNIRLWPFDILYPFETAYARLYGEKATSDADMDDNFQDALARGANTVICYIDDEQSYETFVSEAGFAQTLARMRTMAAKAHQKGLKLICYLNGLEVISVGATAGNDVPSLAKDADKQDWLQQNVGGEKMVWYTDSGSADWVPANSEDAWASPYGPWRTFFKSRVISLAQSGLDGIYVDAACLPGMDNFGEEYASADPYFAAAFKKKYGLDIPTRVDWNSLTWRKFEYFRHETIRDYLSEMKQAFNANATVAKPVVFFEMSAGDTESGTYLANDNQFTISGGVACSPEIEPKYLAGKYAEGFRSAKATRDANQGLPMLFLGWPSNAQNYNRELAITLCLSNNHYPTAENQSSYLAKPFRFIESINNSILSRREPYQNTILIYPMRSKDYTFDSSSTLKAYNDAFLQLEKAHIPFRIVTLETLTATDLLGIQTVVLAGAEAISDAEYNLIKTKQVVLLGKNGTKNEWGTARTNALTFGNVAALAALQPNLPFSLSAPATSFVEYYTDQDNPNHFFLFVYNDVLSGTIQISRSESMRARVYGLDTATLELAGTEIAVPVKGYLTVIDIYD